MIRWQGTPIERLVLAEYRPGSSVHPLDLPQFDQHPSVRREQRKAPAPTQEQVGTIEWAPTPPEPRPVREDPTGCLVMGCCGKPVIRIWDDDLIFACAIHGPRVARLLPGALVEDFR